MKKQILYSLILFLSTIVFTGCEDERFQTVDKNMLYGAAWHDFWIDKYGNECSQVFIFNDDFYGFEIFMENDYTEVYNLSWKWRGYTLEILCDDGRLYEWDVRELNRDVIRVWWQGDELTYFPAW